jgi:hypothetical protein
MAPVILLPVSSQLRPRDSDGELWISESFVATVEHAAKATLNGEAASLQSYSQPRLQVNEIDQTRTRRSRQHIVDHRERNLGIGRNQRSQLGRGTAWPGEQKPDERARAADDSQLGLSLEQTGEQCTAIGSERA